MTERSPQQERAEQIRRSRQVIAGPDVPPPGDPLEFADDDAPTSSPVFWYLVALSVLLVLSALLWAVWGMGAASLPLLLLAVGLLLAWFML